MKKLFYFFKFCTKSFQLVSVLLPLLRRFCSHLWQFVCWLILVLVQIQIKEQIQELFSKFV